MKFGVAAIAAFVISLVWGFVAHGVILNADYGQLPNLFRPQEQAMAYLPYLLLSHLVKGLAFAWVYRQGITPGAPWLMQGIRFGILAALLITIPLYLVTFAVQPFPAALVVKQMALDTIGTFVMAIAVAFVFRPASTEA